jgi:FkbM family methyltransferase
MKKQLLQLITGKISLQKYFRFLYTLSLRGMNYGNGGNFRTSGERFAAEYIKTKLSEENKDLVLFDVGANIGHYGVELSNIFAGRHFVIHSFEPSFHTFEQLVANTSGIPGIVLNNFGLSDTVTKRTLYTTGATAGLASVYQRNLAHFGIAMDQKEEINLSTIDGYCEKNNIEQIHFLKLDIEGHELSALRGARQMIRHNRINYIQFEFGGCNIDSRTFFQDFWYLLKDNYRFYRIVENGLFPIAEYNERFEIFTTINYLAELKQTEFSG